MLTHQQATACYDLLGTEQDGQAFNGAPATGDLIAQSVFEFGCGTGTTASRVLARHLPPRTRYLAVDSMPCKCRGSIHPVKELEITFSQEQPGGSDLGDIKTILIVEDDGQIGELLVRSIAEETPYKPLVVSDGFEALKVTHDLKKLCKSQHQAVANKSMHS